MDIFWNCTISDNNQCTESCNLSSLDYHRCIPNTYMYNEKVKESFINIFFVRMLLNLIYMSNLCQLCWFEFLMFLDSVGYFSH